MSYNDFGRPRTSATLPSRLMALRLEDLGPATNLSLAGIASVYYLSISILAASSSDRLIY